MFTAAIHVARADKRMNKSWPFVIVKSLVLGVKETDNEEHVLARCGGAVLSRSMFMGV